MKNIFENQDIKTDKPLPMSYEALKAERDALQKRADSLAVENACLVKAINDHKNSTHFCERCGEDDPCATDDVCSVLRGIPDTDSAIATFEARGVEKFSDFLGKQYQCEKANTVKGKAYKHVVFLACRFARELREAK